MYLCEPTAKQSSPGPKISLPPPPPPSPPTSWMGTVPPNCVSSDPRTGAVSLPQGSAPECSLASPAGLSRQRHPPLPVLQPLPRSLSPRAGETGVRLPAAQRGTWGFQLFLWSPSSVIPKLHSPAGHRCQGLDGEPRCSSGGATGKKQGSRRGAGPCGAQQQPHRKAKPRDRGTFCSAEEDCVGNVPAARAFAPNSEKMEERAEAGGWRRSRELSIRPPEPQATSTR